MYNCSNNCVFKNILPQHSFCYTFSPPWIWYLTSSEQTANSTWIGGTTTWGGGHNLHLHSLMFTSFHRKRGEPSMIHKHVCLSSSLYVEGKGWDLLNPIQTTWPLSQATVCSPVALSFISESKGNLYCVAAVRNRMWPHRVLSWEGKAILPPPPPLPHRAQKSENFMA